MEGIPSGNMTFGARCKLAWRVLVDGAFARECVSGRSGALKGQPTSQDPVGLPQAKPEPVPAALPKPALERMHASGLALLAALQREGRLVDFLQQDVTGFSDEDVAAAARVVHGGCRRVLDQSFEWGPAVPESEGATVTIPAGFDAQRIRLTGNVAGTPPFRGVLRHPGWEVRAIRLPAVSETLDPRVIAAAEVELS